MLYIFCVAVRCTYTFYLSSSTWFYYRCIFCIFCRSFSYTFHTYTRTSFTIPFASFITSYRTLHLLPFTLVHLLPFTFYHSFCTFCRIFAGYLLHRYRSDFLLVLILVLVTFWIVRSIYVPSHRSIFYLSIFYTYLHRLLSYIFCHITIYLYLLLYSSFIPDCTYLILIYTLHLFTFSFTTCWTYLDLHLLPFASIFYLVHLLSFFSIYLVRFASFTYQFTYIHLHYLHYLPFLSIVLPGCTTLQILSPYWFFYLVLLDLDRTRSFALPFWIYLLLHLLVRYLHHIFLFLLVHRAVLIFDVFVHVRSIFYLRYRSIYFCTRTSLHRIFIYHLLSFVSHVFTRSIVLSTFYRTRFCRLPYTFHGSAGSIFCTVFCTSCFRS